MEERNFWSLNSANSFALRLGRIGGGLTYMIFNGVRYPQKRRIVNQVKNKGKKRNSVTASIN